MNNDQHTQDIQFFKNLAIHAIHEELACNAINAQQADSIEAILDWIDDDTLIDALLTVNDIAI